jgi:hypothetical protein
LWKAGCAGRGRAPAALAGDERTQMPVGRLCRLPPLTAGAQNLRRHSQSIQKRARGPVVARPLPCAAVLNGRSARADPGALWGSPASRSLPHHGPPALALSVGEMLEAEPALSCLFTGSSAK